MGQVFVKSKKAELSLFFFIDALGWEVYKNNSFFLKGLVKDAKRLRTILGYSSACDPSIISGLLPYQHLHWSSFYYSPETCPYRWVKYLNFLPSRITKYQRVRNKLSQIIKKIHRFTGYFQIYQVPFKYLPYFDYAEKYSIWVKDGLSRGSTIFDEMIKAGVPYYVDDSAKADGDKLEDLRNSIENQEIRLAYCLLGKLDAVMHMKGTRHADVHDLMKWYDKELRQTIAVAEENYEKVNFFVFTDHGMHNVEQTFDLQKKIESLGFEYGKDYVAVYDSTMGRFWFQNEKARSVIQACLTELSCGRIVPDEELEDLGVYFADHMYGETIFLMHSNWLIIPSFMGLKPIPGMHGYHPDDPDSYASICSNMVLPENLDSIEQIYWLMLNELGLPIPKHEHIPGFVPRSDIKALWPKETTSPLKGKTL
ncbi:MAG: hypothetical protein CMO81_04405 [Waddliaceae bacterium]|nr:hypothetical protein [Waddliaceae bacterium]